MRRLWSTTALLAVLVTAAAPAQSARPAPPSRADTKQPAPASRFAPVLLPGPQGDDYGATLRFRGRDYASPSVLDSVGVSSGALVMTYEDDHTADGEYAVRIVGLGGVVRLARVGVEGLALTDRSSHLAAWSQYDVPRHPERHRLLKVVDTRTGEVTTHRFEDDVEVQAIHGDQVIVGTGRGRHWLVTPGHEPQRYLAVPQDSVVLDLDERHVVYEDRAADGSFRVQVADLAGHVLRRLPPGFTAALHGDRVAGIDLLPDNDHSTAYLASVSGGPITRLTSFRDAAAVDWLASGRLLVRTIDLTDSGRERAALCRRRGSSCARLADGGLPLLPDDVFGTFISEG